MKKNNLEVLKPQMAGILYSRDPENLLKDLQDLFKKINSKNKLNKIPKALIIPHGGFLYSGSIAAQAFSLLNHLSCNQKSKIKNIIILAPAHQLSFSGIATHQAHYFSTPLGDLELNQDKISELFQVSELSYLDLAFIKEHTIEMVLPFIQYVFGSENVSILPFIIGECGSQSVLDLLELIENPDKDLNNNLSNDLFEESLIIISSDLSHYQPYSIAKEQDESTCDQIMNKKWQEISHDDACGDVSIRALLQYAEKKSWTVGCLDLKNSGDITGDKDKVVGYGAFYFY